MKSRPLLAILLGLMAACWCLPALGQQYTVEWYKIAGGGGTSTGSVFSVSGTIGQADAGGPMSGGGFSLSGGFWAGVDSTAAPGVPQLTISHSGNNVVVSWPSLPAGFRLQQNTNLLNAAGWTPCAAPVGTTNGVCSVTLASVSTRLFFRLCLPGSPRLSVARAGNRLTVSWPSAASGFSLQQNNSPANPAGWSTCPGAVSTTNGINSVNFTPAAGNLFLRLSYP